MTGEAPIEELKAIAHPLRFRIVQLLRNGELNVGEIEQASGIRQPALSQQLGILRKVDLVETRKEAKLVFYSLNGRRLAEVGALVGGLDSAGANRNAHARPPFAGAANFARMSGTAKAGHSRLPAAPPLADRK